MISRLAQRRALQEADALLRDLDVPQDEPIDVFAMIHQLDLMLVFNNLKTILGALVPQGAGGIMLSTQRGAAVQRYTAAHELGHWVLDHELAFDTEADLYTPSHDREQLAQIFASQLLMPPPLVFATAASYGVNHTSATAPAVYLMARDMGASYEAVVRQLDNLGIIGRNKRDELLAIQPATIKTQLTMGHRPVGQVDVWPVDMASSGAQITVTEGDEVVIMLPENRTTGYQWLTEEDLGTRSMRRVRPAPPIAGSAPVPDRDWNADEAATEAIGGPTRQEIDRALLNIPGNAGATRILRDDSTGPAAAGRGDAITEATEELLDVTELRPVDDIYHPSWTSARPSERRAERRSIARGEPLTRAHDIAIERAAGVLRPPAPTAADLGVGGTGTRVIALRSAGEGHDTYRLVYTSAYDPAAAPAETYQLDVTIAPSPAAAQRKRYLRDGVEPGLDDQGELDHLGEDDAPDRDRGIDDE